MNTAKAIVILGDLAPQLKRASDPEGSKPAAAMLEYRSQLLKAWRRDLGDRSFTRGVELLENRSSRTEPMREHHRLIVFDLGGGV